MEGAEQAVFPEVGLGAEPIVGVFTDGEVCFASENAFRHSLIASMKTQHRSGRNHDLTITSPNFITLGDESVLEQEGNCNFTGNLNNESYNLTVGQYNTSVTEDLFTVGNGTSDTARANSLTVSGTEITGTVNIPGTAEITAVPDQGAITNFTGTLPAWWSSALHGFMDSTAGTVDSFANIGQLKYVSSRAKLYLDSRFA